MSAMLEKDNTKRAIYTYMGIASSNVTIIIRDATRLLLVLVFSHASQCGDATESMMNFFAAAENNALLTNHCSHYKSFLLRVFNAISNRTFPVVFTPFILIGL